jgi:iron-sulfur cluster insertion protein
MKITVDKSAIEALKEVLKEHVDKPNNIRVHFAGVGCGGPSFGLALDEQNENDLVYEVEDLKFIMDKNEYDQYGDILIQDTGYGFKVAPENMDTSQSGCSGCSGGCN